ncbi:MAG TPA: ABC transporter ATP-binding protein [Geminicoccaceae bacterium]|nr:ABC transporter ATP-binding protein [Geminicoccaceae bacterium]
MTDGAPLLEAIGLTRRFGGLSALEDLDLEVRRGEILGLIGPNGSGKTTFFNVVTGIYPVSAGRVTFAGAEITHLSPQQVHRAGIARTFQRSRLCLPLSIFDNVMVGNHGRLNCGLGFNLFRRAAFRAEYEANFAAARELVARFDPPLADRMFETVGAIPMIDRRRIEICRALISQPKLLLLDEPSAGMTREETRQLMADIRSARAQTPGLSVIIIEHEMAVIEEITERCVVLNYGRKIAEGTYREVAAERQVQEAYLGLE